jgi:hypothetical protein
MSCLMCGWSSRRLGSFLSGFLSLSATMLSVVGGTACGQAARPPMELVSRDTDIDRHEHSVDAIESMMPHQQHTGPHMRWTTLGQPGPNDVQRADEIVRTLRRALARYTDYRVALDEGFAPLHPERKPKHYHFVNKQHRFKARVGFDAAEPSALLYKKTDEGYELEGAMYTAPRGTSEDELNARIPLSIAQWHAHVNLCFSPDGSRRRLSRRQFGFRGTIVTETECRQAGGQFIPQAGGWMIHVYPFKTSPAEIWTH